MRNGGKLAAGATAIAVALPIIAACGDPIKANHDWQAVTAAVTVSTTVDEPGLTIHDQQQVLTGKIATGDSFDSVVEKSSLRVTCEKVTSTPTGVGPNDAQWTCTLWLNSGDRLYYAQGRTADGVFGTFRVQDRPGSTGTITVSKIKVLTPPTLPMARAAELPTGGTFYLVKVAARR